MSSKPTPKDARSYTLKIPGKTFLTGEYGALLGEACLLVATGPHFEVRAVETQELRGLSSESPAGKFWRRSQVPLGLEFIDPYGGAGGFGASGAQFLGAWCFAKLYREGELAGASDWEAVIKDYHGMLDVPGGSPPPSGADMAAQLAGGVCYFHRTVGTLNSYAWPFSEISFVLLKTPLKLATHEHLAGLQQKSLAGFGAITDKAARALQAGLEADFLESIKEASQLLAERSFLAPESERYLKQLAQAPSFLAGKGCGALGADVLLVFCKSGEEDQVKASAIKLGLQPMGTQEGLSQGLAWIPKGVDVEGSRGSAI